MDEIIRSLPADEAIAASIRSLEVDDGTVDQTNTERRALGMQELRQSSVDDDDDDTPACDACGEEGTGSLRCGRCKSAYYCSRGCQVVHWKNGGHKRQCPTLRVKSEDAGRLVVETAGDARLPALMRVQGFANNCLDGARAYEAAVANGLHGAVQALFRDDRDRALDRWRAGGPENEVFCTQFIMNSLFRGQRLGGVNCPGSFKCVDKHRIKNYLRSDESAFDDWFDASIAVVGVVLDHHVYSRPDAHALARHTARDVWAAWTMVFTNKRASKEILLAKEEASKVAIARATSIMTHFKVILAVLWNVPSADMDPRGTLSGNMHICAAMASYWCRAFRIPVDCEQLLGMEDDQLKVYRRISVPVGEATIAKGSNLTVQEAQDAMKAVTEPRE